MGEIVRQFKRSMSFEQIGNVVRWEVRVGFMRWRGECANVRDAFNEGVKAWDEAERWSERSSSG